MKPSAVALHGSLAGAALLSAYLTWQRPPPTPSRGDVVVLELAPAELERVTYEDGPRRVALLPGDGGVEAPRVWVRQGAEPPPARDGGVLPPDAGTLAAVPERTLRGNDEAERVLEAVAPLMAVRSLGHLEPPKLQELGLARTGRRLEVAARGAAHRFEVAPSAGGLGAPYLLSEESGEVFLLGSPLVASLDAAAGRLVDHRLHGFPPADLRTVEVQAQGRRRTLLLEGKGASAPDPFARAFSDKLLRLVGLEFLGRGELPAGGAPALALRADYRGEKGAPLGFLELGRAHGALYARTEFTAGWVRLAASAEDVLHESTKVLSR